VSRSNIELMRKLILTMRRFPFHPLITAIYMVLSLFALNVDQIKFGAALRALVFVPLGTMGMWVFLWFLLRNWKRAAVLTTLLLVLFFSYGHVYHYLEANPILGLELGRHRILIIIYLVTAAVCIWVSWKKVVDLDQATQLLNLVSVVLILFPLIQIGSFDWQQKNAQRTYAESASVTDGNQLFANVNAPDVYYIVLDGYSRADVLKERFDFDNSAFIKALQGLGFYVAECSQSNYTQTPLSMTASLNFSYLDALDGVNLESGDEAVLYPHLSQNQVRLIFEQMGYAIVAFETNYYWLNLVDVDHYYSAAGRAVNPGEARLPVNGFEAMLIRESAGLVLTDLLAFLPGEIQPDLEYPNRAHAEQVLYSFEKLADVPIEVPGPKFVYAHIVAPHSPIVFGPQGEWVVLPEGLDDAGWRKAHTDEIQYVNSRVLEVVSELIKASARQPVIVIQADHGAMISDQHNHAEILNAYYLPGLSETGLYATISPVNTFRVIFNRYFGGSYPLLEDITYDSLYDQPFDFSELVNDCP
jgi:hypothetical protein